MNNFIFPQHDLPVSRCVGRKTAAMLLVAGSALLSGSPAGALTPPQPYVLAADGVTRLTLEQAGILKPDGRKWAIVLGKALFWDQAVGSDGQGCASCHFVGGADLRTVNTFSPGFLKLPQEDTKFGAIKNFDGEPLPGALVGRTKSGGYPIDSAYELKPGDFPIYSLTDYKNRNSPIEIATDDAVSSQGSFDSTFFRVRRFGFLRDRCSQASGDIFHAGKFAARQVEPRNTPTIVNAAFNLFNFWDGRANRQFNGVGVFGLRDIAGDPKKRLIVPDASGNPSLGHLKVNNASLASQAVGPPLSEKEMSCEGRTFADVGRKTLLRRPLALQKVHSQDSVFGVPNALGVNLRHASGRGLKEEYRYHELIKKAFDGKYWNLNGRFVITDAGTLQRAPLLGYTQMELNFSMYWGIAIMLYEQTLVSDQSRFDTWFASCNPLVTNPLGNTSQAVPIANPVVTCRNLPAEPNAPEHGGFTAQEALGFGLFNNGGVGIRNLGNPACNGCHVGPAVFSEAQFQEGQNFVPVERSRIDLASPAPEFAGNCTLPNAITPDVPVCGGVHDRGFFNIGTRPTSFDPGNGGTDPYGNSLSVSRMFLAEQAGQAVVDPSGIGNRCATPTLIEAGGTPQFPGCPSGGPLDKSKELELVDGTFKTPTIRNVGLTPPYFHFGGYSNLRDVVRFYARGGSRRDKSLISGSYTGDTSGTGPLGKSTFPVAPPTFGINVDFFIRDIKSTDEQIDAIVAFMLTLTDRRVQCDSAPFDHPSLFVASAPRKTDVNKDGRADDNFFEMPEVGASGYDAGSGFCVPNKGDLFAPGMQARSGGPRVPLD